MGGRLGGGCAMGATRYLESLPVGPNHSDSMLSPGLFFQPPQFPASLYRGWAGRDREQETNKAGEDVRRKRETLFCLRSANITHTHTALHTSHLLPWRDFVSTLQKQTLHNAGQYEDVCKGKRFRESF